MTRADSGRLVGRLAAAAFIFTGGVHTSGYHSVVEAATGLEGMLPGLLRALWLVFGFHLIAIGLVVGIVTLGHGRGTAAALAVCGVVPALDAAMQVRFIGFIFPPTAMLAGTALLTLAAAWLSWRRGTVARAASRGAEAR